MFVIASDEQWVEIEGAGLGFTQEIQPYWFLLQKIPGFSRVSRDIFPPIVFFQVCLTNASSNHNVSLPRVNTEAPQSNAIFVTAELYILPHLLEMI